MPSAHPRVRSQRPPDRYAVRRLVGFFLGYKGEAERESLVGQSAIPSLFRERDRGPPNQFQLESGIFAGQAERSPWKGLLAVSLTTESPELTLVGRKSSTGPYRIRFTDRRGETRDSGVPFVRVGECLAIRGMERGGR